MRDLLSLLEKAIGLAPLAVSFPGSARTFVVGVLRTVADAIEGGRTVTAEEMRKYNEEMADIERRLYD